MRKLGSWLALLALGVSACDSGTSTDAGSNPPEPATTAAATAPVAPATTAPIPTTTSTNTSTTTTSTASTSTTTTTTTTTSTTVRHPPVRSIATAGDSLLLGMIPPLAAALEPAGYDFTERWFIGFLDVNIDDRWAEQLDHPPDVLIVYFAPWELFALNRGDLDLGDPNWTDEYVATYIEPRLAQLSATGTEVVWIGPPPSADPIETIQYEILNSVWRRAVERWPTMTWLDGTSLLAGPDGEYVEVDDRVTPPARLFQTDGRHLCPEGGRRMAEGLLALLEERFGVEVDPTWTETDWADNPYAYDFEQCPPG